MIFVAWYCGGLAAAFLAGWAFFDGAGPMAVATLAYMAFVFGQIAARRY